jgi:hypothetical protein
MLRQRGLPVSGKKSDLIMRLRLAEAWAPGGSTEESKENQEKITDHFSLFQERTTASVGQESMQGKDNQSANSIDSSKPNGIPHKIQREPLASRPLLAEVSPNTQQENMMAHTAASAAKSVKGTVSARKRRRKSMRLEVNKTLLELEKQMHVPLA